MKTLRFTETVEHRFVHDVAEPPAPHNDLALLRAYQVAQAPIPEMDDVVASVWKVPAGAEMSVPDKCAGKLVALGYAEEV